VGSGATAPGFTATVSRIGGTSSVAEQLQGWMAEQVVFRSTISASTRTILERNQAQYYGITLAV
jgi:hypothetical protein